MPEELQLQEDSQDGVKGGRYYFEFFSVQKKRTQEPIIPKL